MFITESSILFGAVLSGAVFGQFERAANFLVRIKCLARVLPPENSYDFVNEQIPRELIPPTRQKMDDVIDIVS